MKTNVLVALLGSASSIKQMPGMPGLTGTQSGGSSVNQVVNHDASGAFNGSECSTFKCKQSTSCCARVKATSAGTTAAGVGHNVVCIPAGTRASTAVTLAPGYSMKGITGNLAFAMDTCNGSSDSGDSGHQGDSGSFGSFGSFGPPSHPGHPGPLPAFKVESCNYPPSPNDNPEIAASRLGCHPPMTANWIAVDSQAEVCMWACTEQPGDSGDSGNGMNNCPPGEHTKMINMIPGMPGIATCVPIQGGSGSGGEGPNTCPPGEHMVSSRCVPNDAGDSGSGDSGSGAPAPDSCPVPDTNPCPTGHNHSMIMPKAGSGGPCQFVCRSPTDTRAIPAPAAFTCPQQTKNKCPKGQNALMVIAAGGCRQMCNSNDGPKNSPSGDSKFWFEYKNYHCPAGTHQQPGKTICSSGSGGPSGPAHVFHKIRTADGNGCNDVIHCNIGSCCATVKASAAATKAASTSSRVCIPKGTQASGAFKYNSGSVPGLNQPTAFAMDACPAK